MVLARQPFPDGGFHKPREGREDVDGRVDLLVVQLTVDRDLAFGDVPREIRDRVRNICQGRGIRNEEASARTKTHRGDVTSGERTHHR